MGRILAYECFASIRLGLLFSLIGHEPELNGDAALVSNQGPAFASGVGGAENPALQVSSGGASIPHSLIRDPDLI